MSKTTSLLIGLIACAGQVMAQQPVYKQATAPIEDRAYERRRESRATMLSVGLGNVYENS